MPPEIRVSAKLWSPMSLRLGSATLDVHWLNAPGLNSPLSLNSMRQFCFTCCIIAHRLKFCCFCFEFTSFAGSSLLFWTGFFFFCPFISSLSSPAASLFVLQPFRRQSPTYRHLLEEQRGVGVRGAQLDLTGQRKWAPPCSRGDTTESSIRRWPRSSTSSVPARVSHGSAWDSLLIKACCP